MPLQLAQIQALDSGPVQAWLKCPTLPDDVELLLETRSPEQGREIEEALASEGFAVQPALSRARRS